MDVKGYKHIHCLGIGGIGLSAVARIFKSRGYEVSGSDIKSSAMTQLLQAHGIRVFIGHDAGNLQDADLLVYSNAVSNENPEIAEAHRRGIPVISRAQALGAIMKDYPYSVAVSGTHGKTTTTSMISLVLDNAKKDPTILVGGILDQFGGNVRVGQSDYFVTEACEYMNSFLSLHPLIEIILNIDSDHLDFFSGIEDIAQSFRTFASYVPQDGMVFAYDANPFVRSISDHLTCNVITFGLDKNSDFNGRNIVFSENGRPSFDLYRKDDFLTHMQLSVPGEHNVLNCLAAAACCLSLGVDLLTVKETLEKFTGTQRRFDIIGKTEGGVTVIDDYAHHPTEIRATLSAASKIPHKKLWCLFQPHTYTRTMALFNEFTDAFADADELIFAEIYAAREKNIYQMSSSKLADAVREKHPGKHVRFIADFSEMVRFVKENASDGDIVITMGAGDIYKAGEQYLEACRR